MTVTDYSARDPLKFSKGVTFACKYCREARRRRDPRSNGQIIWLVAQSDAGIWWILHRERGTPNHRRTLLDDLGRSTRMAELDPDDPKAIVFRCRNPAHPPKAKPASWIISRAEKAVDGGYEYVHI